MVKPVKVRNLMIGEGIPKICVPVTGRTKEEVERQAERIAAAAPDLVEWRADYLEEPENFSLVRETLSTLRAILREIPILFTFRTEKEGGIRPLKKETYVNLNRTVAKWGLADALDVELEVEKNGAKPLIEAIHEQGCPVVCSNHHFQNTPETGSLLTLFEQMEQAGADILKIAVMPRTPQDVLRLLEATYKAGEKSRCPLISMAMGGQGVLSRLGGEIFGSSVTFASVEEASAPGQLPIEEMKQGLGIIHRALR
ncbi:MAG: type I 3-dehydroquinate dehydratase [Ruminococcus sp.]|jgi:3-dehydroquinate dehydratase-1